MKWFWTGLTLGAGVGLLFAARSGRETRARLGDVANKAAENVKQQASSFRDRLQPERESSRERAQFGGESQRDREPQASHSRHTHVQPQPPQAKPEHEGVTAEFLTIINEWPHARLIEIVGIGSALASKIISNRPYVTEQDLIDAKLLPPAAIEALRKAS